MNFITIAADIQPCTENRAVDVADLFHDAVHAIDPALYTAEQKEAWAPTPPDYGYWARRLKQKQPFLAVVNERLAGFMELGEDGLIDCAYTHPDFQGRGVASALYQYLLLEARRRKLGRLYAEASLVARPFLEHRGFTVLRKNEVQRNGISLVNFLMERQLMY